MINMALITFFTTYYFFLLLYLIRNTGFPGGLVVKNLSANEGDMGLIPDPLAKETHSSILA